MNRIYEIEATFVAFDDGEVEAWIEGRLRSLGCTDVVVTLVSGGDDTDGK